MSTLEMEAAGSRKQIVATIKGRPVTRGELEIAFNAVADKTNWKNPINAVVDLDAHTLALIAQAVTFFTGSVAGFKALTGTTTSGVGRYRVTAAGLLSHDRRLTMALTEAEKQARYRARRKAELRELRREVAELRAENAALRAEIARLRKTKRA